MSCPPPPLVMDETSPYCLRMGQRSGGCRSKPWKPRSAAVRHCCSNATPFPKTPLVTDCLMRPCLGFRRNAAGGFGSGVGVVWANARDADRPAATGRKSLSGSPAHSIAWACFWIHVAMVSRTIGAMVSGICAYSFGDPVFRGLEQMIQAWELDNFVIGIACLLECRHNGGKVLRWRDLQIERTVQYEHRSFQRSQCGCWIVV